MNVRCLLLLCLPCALLAHNWMTEPGTYNPTSCREPSCSQACPRIVSNMPNSPSSPARVYRRGQRVTMKWARNNHHGGMFRLSLVPVQHMFNRAWHTKLTLVHGCFESGLGRCAPNEDCGTDKRGTSFGRTVTIPTVFRDGIYVVGYVWYGGLRFQKDRGQFSDYFSCSFVRIQGGAPLGGQYKAFFEAGVGDEVKNGKCLTSASAIGDCPEGCDNKQSFYAVPRTFANGGLPPINVASVDGGAGKASAPPPPTSAGNGPSSGGGSKQMPVNTNPVAGGNRNGNAPGNASLCAGSVCCTASCGRCGGSGCNRLPGGSANCCTSVIKRSGRKCGNGVQAPCVRN